MGFTDLDNRPLCHTSSSWARRCRSCGTGNRRTPRHPRNTARSTSYCDLPTNVSHLSIRHLIELFGSLTNVSMYEINGIFLLPRIGIFDKRNLVLAISFFLYKLHTWTSFSWINLSWPLIFEYITLRLRLQFACSMFCAVLLWTLT